MRILYCHKYGHRFNGTEAHLFELMDLMSSDGHEVALFSTSHPSATKPGHDHRVVPPIDFRCTRLGATRKVKFAVHAVYSSQARAQMRWMIEEFRPDVAHVRGICPHLSASVLWELNAHKIPVIYHVNDFRLVCPGISDRHTKRGSGKFWRVLVEDSHSQPRVVTAEAYLKNCWHTHSNCVDQFVAPSEFVKNKLVENGWNPDKILLLPHSQRVFDEPREADADAPILCFGRLSPEKGVVDLLRAMRAVPSVKLQIAGDGSQRAQLQDLAEICRLKNVEFLGYMPEDELFRRIAASRFTVFPSRAYESMGKSILESYAAGRAVIASDLGSRREFVLHGKTGLLFSPGNTEELSRAISSLAQQPDFARQMGRHGRTLLLERHSPEEYCARLTECYADLIRRRRRPFLMGTSNRPLRIAFLGTRGVHAKHGVIETCCEETGKRLAEMGHEVTVYCRTNFTSAMKEFCGMRLVRLPTLRTRHLETMVHTFLSTVHAMFCDYDIVHYQGLGPALFSFLPRLCGMKSAVTVQALDWKRRKSGRFASAFLRLGEWASFLLPNRTLVASRTLQQDFRIRHGVETIYLPNGAHLGGGRHSSQVAQWGIEPGNYILFLGRYLPENNCHQLIDAYGALETPVKLVLAGGSTYAGSYAARLRQDRSDKVRIFDWASVDDLRQLLDHAMLFVLPSQVEEISPILLDAMAAGVCALAGNTPENCEVVDGAGFTFRHEDVGDLERMLRLLISDQRLRRSGARRGQQRVRERYLWSTIAADMERVYQEMVGRTQVAERRLPIPAPAWRSSARAA